MLQIGDPGRRPRAHFAPAGDAKNAAMFGEWRGEAKTGKQRESAFRAL